MIYTAQVQSGRENDVVISLAENGIKAYAPIHDLLERRSGRWHTVKRLLFPGYVFIELEDISPEDYYCIHNIIGVIRVLGKVPAPLTAVEEERLRWIFDIGELMVSKGLVKNGKLYISEGILKGKENSIVKYSIRHKRCTLYCEINGSKHYFDVSAELEKG